MPQFVASDIVMAQNALRRAGLAIIQSFDDESEKAETVKALYAQKVEFFLSLYPWTFASKLVQLNVTSDVPPAQWPRQFRLPADRVGEPIAYWQSADDCAPPYKNFELNQNAVMTDAEVLFCKYTFRADERLWPPYFVNFAELALAEAFATAMTENSKKQQDLYVKAWGLPEDDGAGGAFRMAKKRDAHYTRTRPLVAGGGDLIQARRGAGTRWR